MSYAEAAEILEGSIVGYECDNKGRPNGNVTCDLTKEVLDMAIEACRMRADLVKQMQEMMKALEV